MYSGLPTNSRKHHAREAGQVRSQRMARHERMARLYADPAREHRLALLRPREAATFED
jgi:hypothetical protein